MEILLEPTSNKLMVGYSNQTKPGRMTKPYLSHRFIANCFNAGNIKMEVKVTPTKPGRMTKRYSSHRFITNCLNAGNIKMEVKVDSFRKRQRIHGIDQAMAMNRVKVNTPTIQVDSSFYSLVCDPPRSDINLDWHKYIPTGGYLIENGMMS
nr:hypothetical protein [Tanacetum cinerariifolium]